MAFKFEQLKVWQLALALNSELSVAVKSFPKDEMSILSSQIKRAADSVFTEYYRGIYTAI